MMYVPCSQGKICLFRSSSQAGQLLDTKTQKIGFRRVRVVEDKLVDQPGLTWLFEINGIRIFCGGSNWIPADSFITT